MNGCKISLCNIARNTVAYGSFIDEIMDYYLPSSTDEDLSAYKLMTYLM